MFCSTVQSIIVCRLSFGLKAPSGQNSSVSDRSLLLERFKSIAVGEVHGTKHDARTNQATHEHCRLESKADAPHVLQLSTTFDLAENFFAQTKQ